MIRTLAVAALLALSGCCVLAPGRDVCESRRYVEGWSHESFGGGTKARCSDELLATADTLLPDPAMRPLHGVVLWYPAPFPCGAQPTRTVWGCASPDKPYVSVSVVGRPLDHASDTALAEEVAHWVWARYRPGVLIEEMRPPDADHSGWWEWRDPAFRDWFERVRAETRRVCP